MVPFEPSRQSDSNHHGASQKVAPIMGSTYGRLILFDWLHQPYLYFWKKVTNLPPNYIRINQRLSLFLKVFLWVYFNLLFFKISSFFIFMGVIHAAQDQRCTTEDENGFNLSNLSILLLRLGEEGRSTMVRQSPSVSLTPTTTVHHRMSLPFGKHAWYINPILVFAPDPNQQSRRKDNLNGYYH